jgi:S-DNA-T family DNA segregation ATPase FtsK/SpoIIIE
LRETPRQSIEIDEKFDDAVEVFLAVGRASTSLLQRRMGLGYPRALKLCDQMEARGIIGPDCGARGRELLITEEAWRTFKKARTSFEPSVLKGSFTKYNPLTNTQGLVRGAP